MTDPIRILIVEDNPADAYLEKRALRNFLPVEFDVYCADRLTDALRLLREIRFDVILLDLGLPESGGLETLDCGAQDLLLKAEVAPDMLLHTIRFAMHCKKVQLSSAAQLQASRDELAARLHGVLEVVDDAIITVDADGNIRDWNRGAEALLASRANEVAGRPLREVLEIVAQDGSTATELPDLASGEQGCVPEQFSAEIVDRRQRAHAVEVATLVVQADRRRIKVLSLRSSAGRTNPNEQKVPTVAHGSFPMTQMGWSFR